MNATVVIRGRKISTLAIVCIFVLASFVTTVCAMFATGLIYINHTRYPEVTVDGFIRIPKSTDATLTIRNYFNTTLTVIGIDVGRYQNYIDTRTTMIPSKVAISPNGQSTVIINLEKPLNSNSDIWIRLKINITKEYTCRATIP